MSNSGHGRVFISLFKTLIHAGTGYIAVLFQNSVKTRKFFFAWIIDLKSSKGIKGTDKKKHSET